MLKITALAAAAAVALTFAITPDPAFARSRGGAIAAGVGAGLVAGAIIGSSQRSYYGGPAYADPYYQPVYSNCRMERTYVTDAYGNSRVRRIRVCD